MIGYKNKEEKLLLDRTGVDKISELISEKMKKAGVGEKDVLRVRLLMEEQLLKVAKHFNYEKTVTVNTGKRLGVPFITVQYDGEEFDPTSQNDDIDIFFNDMGIAPHWSYNRGINKLYLKAPYQTPKSEIYLILAVALALLIGLMRTVMPADIMTAVSDYALTPVSNAFMRVLGAFVRFMIFFSVIAGICSIESLSDFSKMGRHISSRMIIRTFIGTGISILIMIPFHHFGQGEIKEGVSQTGKIIELVFSIFPGDLITPFIEGNMLQIIFLAVILGIVMLILGDKAEPVRKLINSLTLLFSNIIGMVCKLLPLYIFTSLLLLIWTNGVDIFIQLWKPLVFCLGICVLFLAVKIAYVCIRFKLDPIKFISTIKGTILLGLVTASSSATLADVIKINEKKLGISPKLNRFGVPFANLLIRSVAGMSLVLIVYYMAEYYSVPVNIGWFITAWIMCSILSISAPPVSGGMLVITGMLMTQLGIPSDGLAVAGLLGLLTDFLCTATIAGLGHCELLINADDLNMLDKDMLNNLRNKK